MSDVDSNMIDFVSVVTALPAVILLYAIADLSENFTLSASNVDKMLEWPRDQDHSDKLNCQDRAFQLS